MKVKFIFSVICFIVLSLNLSLAQQTIELDYNNDESPEKKFTLKSGKSTINEFETSKEIKIVINNLNSHEAGYKYNVVKGSKNPELQQITCETSSNKCTIVLPEVAGDDLKKSNNTFKYVFEILDATTTNQAIAINLCDNIITRQNKGNENGEVTGGKNKQPNPASKESIIKKYQSYYTNPYNVKKDVVYLFFDENGKSLSRIPVNVDQDDEFRIRIIAPKDKIDYYDIDVTEGDYQPSDLEIRPYDTISNKETNEAQTLSETEYTISREFIYGPYTSDFAFTITYNEKPEAVNLKNYKIKINKTYHVGVGVSFINTNLVSPTYDLKKETDSTNSIINTSNGSRTVISFNVIWYWTILQQKNKGSIATRGRDVLKEEPAISIRRLFPTAGVTLDNKFRENLFLGLAYEFARGGNIVAGAHYGKITVLAEGFSEGQMLKKDQTIIYKDKYDWGFYFGINIDTRILNALTR